MALFSLPWYYLLWHYGSGFRDLLGIIVNFFWFIGNLFSVWTLLTTLLRPLKLIEERPANLLKEPDVFIQNLLVNTIMRIVGSVVRLLFIFLAFVGWIVLGAFGVVMMVCWLILPLLVPLAAVLGVSVLFSI